ncbi:hypothetical protein [Sphingomonas crocodyli]|uniref:ParB/Sulfiredoxin domain-containing protein n=1 Tax=Sphingomonas crocodyli TaxID=1979270 RepID=A0A437M536_9SPHN|nr:hypothetical protein [Sphingomonas crocodyli]RVT92840.1 hypothetical protein EOD43_02690 [Sphingomonas crocodyli]
MTAKGKQWATRTLLIDEVREHANFQLRAKGIDRRHATKLARELAAGKTLPALKVAHVGKVLYLVDGFHRLEAHRSHGSRTVTAEVARMSLQEAREEAEKANTKHGLNLSRKDRQVLWDAYIADGRQVDPMGETKSSRVIEAELDGIYSRETIRMRLKAMGLTLNEGEGFKTWEPEGHATEEELAEEAADEATSCLHKFGAIFSQLEDGDQARLLGAARTLVETLERGEDPHAVLDKLANPLGI